MSDNDLYIQTTALDLKNTQAAIEDTDEKRRVSMLLDIHANSARISALDKRTERTHASFERSLKHIGESAAADIKEVKRSVWMLELVAFVSLLLILYSLWPRR